MNKKYIYKIKQNKLFTITAHVASATARPRTPEGVAHPGVRGEAATAVECTHPALGVRRKEKRGEVLKRGRELVNGGYGGVWGLCLCVCAWFVLRVRGKVRGSWWGLMLKCYVCVFGLFWEWGEKWGEFEAFEAVRIMFVCVCVWSSSEGKSEGVWSSEGSVCVWRGNWGEFEVFKIVRILLVCACFALGVREKNEGRFLRAVESWLRGIWGVGSCEDSVCLCLFWVRGKWGEFRGICNCEDCVCVALGVRGENLYVAAFVCTQFWEWGEIEREFSKEVESWLKGTLRGLKLWD